jgi:SSS family solute:Na+ symporter
MNLFFYFWGGKNMILLPQAGLFQLNGFLAAFLAAGATFFTVCLLTRPGRVEENSLGLFFHPALNGGIPEKMAREGDLELVKT